MTKYFVTGDCHGQYKKLELFIKKQNPEDELFIFILGDVGLNWHLKYDLDDEKKKYLSFPYQQQFQLPTQTQFYLSQTFLYSG